MEIVVTWTHREMALLHDDVSIVIRMVTGIHVCHRRQIWPLADGNFQKKG